MKKIIRLTESDLTRIVRRVIKEQSTIDYVLNPSKTIDLMLEKHRELIKKNQEFLNKEYKLKLPVDGKVSDQYTKWMNHHLEILNISKQNRTFLGSLSNMLPVYETYLDFKSIVSGIVNGNKQELLGGITGLSMEGLSYKGFVNLLDYFTEKGLGKKEADKMNKKRKDIINMSDEELKQLFIKYGYGGYDKWVKDGMPDLI